MTPEISAHAWLDQIAHRDAETYLATWDFERCGHIFPLRQKMRREDKHTIFGFRTEKGRISYGAENCYFDVCEKLDALKLAEYMELLSLLTEADVDHTDPMHEFTFMNLVILTHGFTDVKARKELRKYRFMEDYSAYQGHFGWCMRNICVVDLESDILYASALGQTLRERMGDRAEQNRLIRLFKK